MILNGVAPIQTKLQSAFETIKFYLADNVVDHRLKSGNPPTSRQVWCILILRTDGNI